VRLDSHVGNSISKFDKVCCRGVTIGVFGHVASGIVTNKYLDAASKDVGAQGSVTTLVECSETDADLVGLLIAFGGMLSPASLDGGKSSVVSRCKGRECGEILIADDDNEEG